MALMGDRELLLACRRGDEAAWNALVNRYQRLVYAIPRRAGLDEDLAAEVFQEVFLTLFEKLDAIEQPERLQAWIVTTARRKTLRLIARESRTVSFSGKEEDSGDSELETLSDDAPLPDDVMVKMEEQHRVRAALEELDERCNKLLVALFYTSEPPAYSEIAKRIGMPEGSVGPTRARCLQKLMRIIERQ